MRTQVAIIGSGPSGLLLGRLLTLAGIDNVIIDRVDREYILARVRAGVLEQGMVAMMREARAAERLDAEGLPHEGFDIALNGALHHIDLAGLTGGKRVTIYGQTELQKDLYDRMDQLGINLIDEAEDLDIAGIEGDSPTVTFTRAGVSHEIVCDYVVGCDGAHGTTRDHIPASAQSRFERLYPFVWVGLLSATPPVNPELIYANHPDGFALCSMRNENLSRYYVQGAAEDTIDDWPDDRFWEALSNRLPPEISSRLVTGPSIEKLVTPLRSWVAEPLRHGRLFLAGDAAHVVPPTGAKGLNLAISDVVYLAEALASYFATGSETGLDEYSARALRRVWKAVRFSWWMTNTMHRFPGASDDFDRRLQRTELEYLFSSESAQRSLAENYVGLPYE